MFVVLAFSIKPWRVNFSTCSIGTPIMKVKRRRTAVRTKTVCRVGYVVIFLRSNFF